MMAWAPVSSSETAEKPLDREKLLEFFSKQEVLAEKEKLNATSGWIAQMGHTLPGY